MRVRRAGRRDCTAAEDTDDLLHCPRRRRPGTLTDPAAPVPVVAVSSPTTGLGSWAALRLSTQGRPMAEDIAVTPRDEHKVVIIGAGPAGLTAAYQLGKHGIPSTVLEADDVVGGISRTVERDG